MAKPGPRPTPVALKVVNGTARADRVQGNLFPTDAAEAPVRPKWLKADARKLWDEKVATYMARGQPVAGFESALAQYCTLEAELVAKKKAGVSVPGSMYATWRAFANDFFDTPAAQASRGGLHTPKAANPFTERGAPPPPPGKAT